MKPRKKTGPGRSRKVLSSLQLAITIRKARPQDFESILKLISEQRKADGRQARASYQRDYGMKKHSSDQVWVALRADQIVGVSGYWYDRYADNGVYWLGWTYVSKKYQRKGVGQKLLDRVMLGMEKRKARKLYVDTSSAKMYQSALLFYTKNGFEIEGVFRNYYQRGEDQIVLGKELKP
jgi:ribosomal protein S18 acetylase RimI-like enzyme